MFKILDAIPSFVWLLLCIVLGGLLVTANLATGKARSELAGVVKERDTIRNEFGAYREDAAKKQEIALTRVRELETASQENTERVAREQAKREQDAAAERARLLARERGVRDELSAFHAATARDAESRDVAALAAKAGTAVQLYEACGIEYRSMAADAESVRVQAVGLLDFIRGNSMCSQPFGQTTPAPAE